MVSIEQQVELAISGDEAALEQIIYHCQNQIYNLAIRMLWHPNDAEDATQEILIKVITHLSQFRKESAFSTWVYRIAINHLLNLRKQRAEVKTLTFEAITEGLELKQTASASVVVKSADEVVDQKILAEEIRQRCTLGMLLCLDRNHRLAFILGESLELSSADGAYILDISEANFRKRLSRARAQLRGIMENSCGLVSEQHECSCQRKLNASSDSQKQAMLKVLLANPLGSVEANNYLQTKMREFQELDRLAALFRSHPNYIAPDTFVQKLKQLIASRQSNLL